MSARPPLRYLAENGLPSKDELVAALGGLEPWAAQCHAAALHLVKSGVLPDTARVARGTCPGVGGQHSWIVVEGDCYDKDATVLDATLWSYDPTVEGIWIGSARERPHDPFGFGSILNYGKPQSAGGEPITLEADLSPEAQAFLDILGPLDRTGWAQLAHAPVGHWPAAEIFAAMYQDDRLAALIPIDIVGMATDLNPQGLYR